MYKSLGRRVLGCSNTLSHCRTIVPIYVRLQPFHYKIPTLIIDPIQKAKAWIHIHVQCRSYHLTNSYKIFPEFQMKLRCIIIIIIIYQTYFYQILLIIDQYEFFIRLWQLEFPFLIWSALKNPAALLNNKWTREVTFLSEMMVNPVFSIFSILFELQLLRSAVGMTHVLWCRLVMGCTT